MTFKNEEKSKIGVSIIACTNKNHVMENILSNYENQTWHRKELIVVLNKDSLNKEEWMNRVGRSNHISVYQLPQKYSLGKCLNFGVSKAKYEYIAKFDDDDYYGPNYLSESIKAFERTSADVVGKRTAFMYLVKRKQLRLRFVHNENRWVRIVLGGTIIAKKEVVQKVRFANRSLGEDTNFLIRCRKKGFRVYSTSRYNYTYLRKGDRTHTWKPNRNYLMRTSKKICYTNNFKKLVNK